MYGADHTISDDPPKTYTESEIASFETTWGIRLPDAYRGYLLRVGAGEFTRSRVSLLEEWHQPGDDEHVPTDFLARPFPHLRRWNDRNPDDFYMGWQADYYSDRHICGAMRVVSTGCEGYHLLVISGPERGYMWHDDRACHGRGIYPLRSWFGRRWTFDDYISSWGFLRI